MPETNMYSKIIKPVLMLSSTQNRLCCIFSIRGVSDPLHGEWKDGLSVQYYCASLLVEARLSLFVFLKSKHMVRC